MVWNGNRSHEKRFEKMSLRSLIHWQKHGIYSIYCSISFNKKTSAHLIHKLISVVSFCLEDARVMAEVIFAFADSIVVDLVASLTIQS